jgi:hypothetical protein
MRAYTFHYLQWLFQEAGLPAEAFFAPTVWSDLDLSQDPREENLESAIHDVVDAINEPGKHRVIAEATVADAVGLGEYERRFPGRFLRFVQPVTIEGSPSFPPSAVVYDPRRTDTRTAARFFERLTHGRDPRSTAVTGRYFGVAEFVEPSAIYETLLGGMGRVFPVPERLPEVTAPAFRGQTVLPEACGRLN